MTKGKQNNIFTWVMSKMVIPIQYPDPIKEGDQISTNQVELSESKKKSLRNKNRLSMILKLIVVVPLFYSVGMYVGNDILNGSYISLFLSLLLCPLVGYILAKI